MKLFISIPTNGRADSEVDAEKAAILGRIRATYDEPVELIDSYVSEDAPVTGDRAGAWYLGESIKRLATADVAYFADGWDKARGCRLEFSVCKRYGIPVIANSELAEIMDYADALQQSAKEHPDAKNTLCGFWRPNLPQVPHDDE